MKKAQTTLLLQAIARGWCSQENSKKEMDENLAFGIAEEVEKFIDNRNNKLLKILGTITWLFSIGVFAYCIIKPSWLLFWIGSICLLFGLAGAGKSN